jgi:branched-chain amino acid transport system substrate-binding protein
MAPVTRVRNWWGLSRRAFAGTALAAALGLLSACTGMTDLGSSPPPPQTSAPPVAREAVPNAVRVALILPLSAGGNAGTVALSMKNAAEMALAEFTAANVQLLIKDDGGNASGSQQAAQEALNEGAEIIVGPLFAQSVKAVGGLARQRGVPVIAFSTDATVAARGIYLLSFLPESDVARIVDYAVANGKRSFAAMLSEGAYGNVVEAEFKQAVSRKGARIVASERYAFDQARLQTTAKVVAQAARGADALFIPEGPEVVPSVVQALMAAGLDAKRLQMLGTGLWDDPRILNEPALQGGLFAAPDNTGFSNFVTRYRARYGQDPVRTATLAFDALALIAALVKTQGPQRFSDQILTNPSGFSGIDGLFRFRSDGTNERGLAIMRVGPGGSEIAAPPPRAFGGSGT